MRLLAYQNKREYVSDEFMLHNNYKTTRAKLTHSLIKKYCKMFLIFH